MDGELQSPPYRRRLPNRRKAITETIVVGNATLSVSVGFDVVGHPAEVPFRKRAIDSQLIVSVRVCIITLRARPNHPRSREHLADI